MALMLKLDDEAPSMVSNVLTLAVQRVNREEHNCTKQDSHFSNWKVIVGPRDWEDYSVDKDGAERYRVHNLPRDEGPGVYELGVAATPNGSGRGIKADQIVPVYVGQADSARTRLQKYGRTGAHLGKSCSVGKQSELIICKGPGLFEEMLARGYTIVYRWAPMRTKSEALRAERKLLDTFDYAWNTKLNVSRRHDDVLQKLKKISSQPTRFTTNLPRQLPFRQKQACIRINSSNLISTDEKFSDYADRESRNLIPHVIKFGRSQPRLVLDGSEIIQENTTVCGVVAGDGFKCRKAPVQGRKRCAEHKGMKIAGSSKDSNREIVSYESGITRENAEICGVTAGDGSTCRRPPVQGRKRCAEHKGMRNTESVAVSNRELVTYKSGITWDNTEICGVAASDGSTCRRPPVQGRKRCAEHKGMWSTGSTTANNGELVTHKSRFTWENTEICGVAGGDGSPCKRPPVEGRKRCAEHKGMWNTGSTTASNREPVTYKSGITWDTTEICGVAASDGSTCRRPPVQGRKRCAEHKGMWSTGSTTASSRGMWSSGSTTASSREFVSYKSHISREYTEICGATTANGTPCKRSPANGRVRCSMHKGMRTRW